MASLTEKIKIQKHKIIFHTGANRGRKYDLTENDSLPPNPFKYKPSGPNTRPRLTNLLGVLINPFRPYETIRDRAIEIVRVKSYFVISVCTNTPGRETQKVSNPHALFFASTAFLNNNFPFSKEERNLLSSSLNFFTNKTPFDQRKFSEK